MRKAYESIQNLDYLQCNKTGHENAPLNIICADYSCLNRSLLCAHCEQNDHPNHDVIPLKGYMKKLLIATNINMQSQNIFYWTAFIEQVKKDCITSLQNFKYENMQLIDCIIHQVMVQYNNTSLKIKELMYLNQKVNGLIKYYNSVYRKSCSQQDDFQPQSDDKINIKTKQYQKAFLKINEKFRTLLNYTSVESMETQNNQDDDSFSEQNYKISRISPQIEILAQSYINKCKDLNKILSKVSTETNNSTTKMIECLKKQVKTANSFKSISFNWSQTHKASGIFINGNVIQRKPGNNIERFALFKQELLPYIQRRKNVTWAIKIVKLTGWIGIGVCLKQKIVSSGYKFSYQSLGHGSYMISSNGYSWSSSVQTSNSAYHSFSFTTNDIVIVEFECQPEWKLNFYVCKQQVLLEKASNIKSFGSQVCISKTEMPSLKNSGDKSNIWVSLSSLQKTHELKIEKNSDYIPCVNLCSVGDSVSIVS